MLKFFSHKKFWLPFIIIIVLLIIVELLLRLDLYNGFVKPDSYLGNSLERVRAVNDFGKDDIQWITVGDSRVDWGIDHKELRRIRKEKGVNHLRMSFRGSNFMAIQATIDWSIENMGSLEGVLVGVSEDKISHKHLFNELYNIAWPFKNNLNFHDYNLMLIDNEKWRIYHSLALVTFYKDIKNFISNPVDRFIEIKSFGNKETTKVFDYKRVNPNNLCSFRLDSLESCIKTADIFKKSGQEQAGFRLPVKLCSTYFAKKRSKTNKPVAPVVNEKSIVDAWQHLIEHVLNSGKKFYLLLLPDHEMYNYMIKPSNSAEITEQIILKFQDHPNFLLIDLRNLIKPDQHCKFYSDTLHFNNRGIDLFTKETIRFFNQNIH